MNKVKFPGGLLKGLLFSLCAAAMFWSCSGDNKQSAGDNDPYLWLEEVEGEKALAWVREQNKHTEETISSDSLFRILEQRYVTVFNDREKIIYPNILGSYTLNLWQDEKNERGLWRRMLLENYLKGGDDWEVMLDLDILSEKENRKWVYKGSDWLSPESSNCLLMLSDGGKDESVIREFNVSKKEFVSDGFSVDESKGSAAWVDNDNIIVATDFGSGTMSASGYPVSARLWKRGTALSEAPEIVRVDTAYMGVFTYGITSGRERLTFVDVRKSFYESELHYLIDGRLNLLSIPKDAQFQGFFSGEMLLHLQSDWTVGEITFMPGSLVSCDLASLVKGDVKVKTIYAPDERSSFISLLTTKDFVVIQTMENVQSKLTICKPGTEGWMTSPVATPEMGTISLITSDDFSDDFFFTFSNLITPTTLFYCNGRDVKKVRQQKEYFNAGGLVVEQYSVASKDSTLIPYFIVHKADMKYDSKNPTLVYGYGGFNVPEQQYYSSVTGIGWLEQGGVYVIANIRGGGEFGPAWHKAALKEKRQNAYDDFFAVAEDLIRRNIASPETLGAFGWSNGGLLAGVAFTQRPDLYKAVVVGAPLLDMKRYSRLLAGASWMGEYGDPDNPLEWDFIKKYSPYHNLSKEKSYPEVLFITSTRDDRVHPGHARKMAARMTELGHPFYYHETIEGGHGAASTNAQQAYVWATVYAYLNMKLNRQ